MLPFSSIFKAIVAQYYTLKKKKDELGHKAHPLLPKNKNFRDLLLASGKG